MSPKWQKILEELLLKRRGLLKTLAGTEPTEGDQMRARELARMKARKKEKK
jgi:hypothetical protein